MHAGDRGSEKRKRKRVLALQGSTMPVPADSVYDSASSKENKVNYFHVF